ncbi:MAG: class I SAM-dependent DNA methyltransferase [Chloroflexi bacterium]|nr:class I SAM-dependent DNA methyltransferase [Chloroflexota bacterium]
MTAAEFKKKWHRYQGTETSGYSEHFNDLCRLLGQPTPAEADPSGRDFFCFQKRVLKDAELFERPETGEAAEPSERGFADVWKKGCFAWEYKGKKKNLDEAYRQLLRYRESLLNPPLLVVCDFDRYIVRTNFNGTVQETHEFTNEQIDRPENLRLLRALFEHPEFLKPQRTTLEVTKTLAEKFAQVARSLQKRESAELADARTRAEVTVAQRKNLRIARFLNRLIFCFFAEDTGLLPKNLFSDVAKIAFDDPHQFSQALESLFRTMAKGGLFGHHKIRHFNGHLFEDSTVFELNDEERRTLAEASEADWQFVEPSIMGTLFARGLDPDQRAALGAQYTGRDDIVTIVEPVLMAPFRREWAKLKTGLTTDYADSTDKKAPGKPSVSSVSSVVGKEIEAFLKKLRSLIVMDPACGSGNFLYVSLQMLLDLEKEVITFATQLGFQFQPEVGVHQLRAIEINPYAYELAQVTVQIGCLQWLRENGFALDRSPVLQVLEGFHNEDALLRITFRTQPKNLKEAQEQEHEFDSPFQLRAFHEQRWPECDVIVSNPPFLGDKLMRGELGNEYVVELRRVFSERLPGQSDFCCYWFEKAREAIAEGKCHRAGLLATQGIRGSANREVLKRIKQSGNIFFAVSDRNWILDGANVHVSMVGFDDGGEAERWLDGKKVEDINANLSTNADLTRSRKLSANEHLSFLGSCKGGDFDISEAEALNLATSPGAPRRKLNSDLVRPVKNSEDLLQRPANRWIIDTADMSLAGLQLYRKPHAIVVARVKPHRDRNRDKWLRENWWRPQRMRPQMRVRIHPLERFLVTTTTSKHRVFLWLQHPILPDHQLIVFSRDDDYFMGVLQSRLHEIWALAQGTQLREKESGFRYTPTTCFETFPFPFPDDLQPPKTAPFPPSPEPETTELNGGLRKMVTRRFLEVKEEPPPYGGEAPRQMTPDQHRAAIAAAAKELNELRERWLNPPEWTETRTLEFPGSVNGPWSRYIDPSTLNPQLSTGLVRYPRLEPRDADCAAQLKKRTLTNLYNERPAWLELAHKKLDAAVAAAYGWPADLTDEQILEKLLALNLERAAEEANAAKVQKAKASREKQADEML